MKTYDEMAKSALEKIEKHKKIKRKRQKTAIAVIIPVFTVLIFSLLLSFFENTDAPLADETKVIDITAEIPAKNTNSVKTMSGMLSLTSPYKTDEEKFQEEKSVVIRGRVIFAKYVLKGSTVYTKSEIEIIKCYKGGLEKGDVISVKEPGGFIPSDVLSSAISEEKFGEAPKNTEETGEMLDIRVEGFKVMEKDEEVILFLLPTEKTDMKEFENSYELIRLWQGKLLYDENYGAFLPYCPSWDLALNNEANENASIKIKNAGENENGAQARAYTPEEFELFAKQFE